MLTDPHGIVLQTEGDPSALEAALDIRLMAGANWTELNCGTNAIGTALSTREPVQVHACEHFCIGIKPWTCSATVVHDPINGEVLGALAGRQHDRMLGDAVRVQAVAQRRQVKARDALVGDDDRLAPPQQRGDRGASALD